MCSPLALCQSIVFPSAPIPTLHTHCCVHPPSILLAIFCDFPGTSTCVQCPRHLATHHAYLHVPHVILSVHVICLNHYMDILGCATWTARGCGPLGAAGHFHCNFFRGWRTSGWTAMRRRAVLWLLAGRSADITKADHMSFIYHTEDNFAFMCNACILVCQLDLIIKYHHYRTSLVVVLYPLFVNHMRSG